MTTLRQAAQQALEALEQRDNATLWHQAIHALRAALAQQEQEPVAWQWLDTGHFRKKLPVDAEPGAWNPLYTHPPRREWQSLTEEEIRAAYGKDLKYRDGDYERFARAIEAKLKERNA